MNTIKHSPIKTVFRLAAGVHIERFVDGALVVRMPEHKIIELNTTAEEVLILVDGTRSLGEVAAEVAQNHEVLFDDVLADIKDLCLDLQEWRILVEVTIHSDNLVEEN